jgi:hypothetical protein
MIYYYLVCVFIFMLSVVSYGTDHHPYSTKINTDKFYPAVIKESVSSAQSAILGVVYWCDLEEAEKNLFDKRYNEAELSVRLTKVEDGYRLVVVCKDDEFRNLVHIPDRPLVDSYELGFYKNPFKLKCTLDKDGILTIISIDGWQGDIAMHSCEDVIISSDIDFADLKAGCFVKARMVK